MNVHDSRVALLPYTSERSMEPFLKEDERIIIYLFCHSKHNGKKRITIVYSMT